MDKKEIVRIKHLEACKKWRDNNREKFRKVALDSVNKRRSKDVEGFKKTMRDRAKKYKLKDPEKYLSTKREEALKRRRSNPEKANQTQREYRKKNPDKFKKYYLKHRDKRLKSARKSSLMKKYGLTPDDYEKMLSKQEGKCAICEFKFGDSKPNIPNIDHCHVTGRIRGLLCAPCNVVLGYVENRETTISNFYERFTKYLK